MTTDSSVRGGLLRIVFALMLATLIVPQVALGLGLTSEERELFRIERSVNRNVVRYAAREIGSALDAREPVMAYGLRLAEDGRRRDLSWLERQFAYGLQGNLGRQRASARRQSDVR